MLKMPYGAIRFFVITPLGTRVKRILVSGTVTAKSSEDNYTKLTVLKVLTLPIIVTISLSSRASAISLVSG